MKILVLNAGSSSQKSCLYEVTQDTTDAPKPLWEAAVDWTHQQGVAEVKLKTGRGADRHEEIQTTSRIEVVTHLLDSLWQGETQVISQLTDIAIVGHRVVHGGDHHSDSVLITDAVKQTIADLAVLAPNHNPAHLEGIEAIAKILPNVPQVAVFDTAFHTTLPAAAATYAIPYALTEKGIRRYGFHGTSHRYCANRAAELLQRDLTSLKLITCHLGNGCSLAAIANGQSIDTTMGFTPLEGLMMGSRSGSIDPAILLYLIREEAYDADKLDQLLNKESGLKGVSGLSADMRQVSSAAAEGHDRAQLALDMFVHRLNSCIGSMLASLGSYSPGSHSPGSHSPGGPDALVFTAGVGENSALIRERTCAAFGFLGLKLDLEKNQQRPVDTDIATENSTVRVLVIHTEEDWAIAQECRRLYPGG